VQRIKITMHDALNKTLDLPLREKNNAERTQRAEVKNTTEAALKMLKRNIMPIQPSAEPIRFTL
jgi:hypothetical protein